MPAVVINRENEAGDKFVLLKDADIGKMKVDNSREELKSRNLTVGGKKAELVKRLMKAMVDKVYVTVNRTTEPASTSVFDAGTNWVLLTPQDKTLDDTNSGTSFHAPTPNFLGMVSERILLEQRREIM